MTALHLLLLLLPVLVLSVRPREMLTEDRQKISEEARTATTKLGGNELNPRVGRNWGVRGLLRI